MNNKKFKLLLETYKKNVQTLNEENINDIIIDLVYLAQPFTSDDLSWIENRSWRNLNHVLRDGFAKHLKGSAFQNFKISAEDMAEEEGIR